ncbi:hypothetical protein [Actinocorallia populi]|nr:hypothetical protein [Actinocorallia populi]
MRILVAIIAGVLLATASSMAVVSASTGKPAPKPNPIYNYGAR